MELECDGLVVTKAYGSTEGLEALQAREFDIVLCDFQMGGMDGHELVLIFREWEAVHRPQGKLQTIVGLTAYATTEVKEQCLESGMQAVLTKPLETHVIIELVQKGRTHKQPAESQH